MSAGANKTKRENFKGYEGIGPVSERFSAHNFQCFGENGSHPPFPFEFLGYKGFLIENEEDLRQALVANKLEGERRRKAKI